MQQQMVKKKSTPVKHSPISSVYSHAQTLVQHFSPNSQCLLNMYWEVVVSLAFSCWATSSALRTFFMSPKSFSYSELKRLVQPAENQRTTCDLGHTTGTTGNFVSFSVSKIPCGFLKAQRGDFYHTERMEFKSVWVSLSAFSQVRWPCFITNDWKNMWGFFNYGKLRVDGCLQILNCCVTYVRWDVNMYKQPVSPQSTMSSA